MSTKKDNKARQKYNGCTVEKRHLKVNMKLGATLILPYSSTSMPCNVDIPPPAITHRTAFLLTTTPRLPAISVRMSWDMVIASFETTIPTDKSTLTTILRPHKGSEQIHPVMKGKIVKPKGSITREYRWEDVGLEEEELENIKVSFSIAQGAPVDQIM